LPFVRMQFTGGSVGIHIDIGVTRDVPQSRSSRFSSMSPG
jgi:hypothetical protein